jgi:hypothetical protein
MRLTNNIIYIHNMKRLPLIIVLATLVLAGCNKQKGFSVHTISGEQCYQVIFDKEKAPWGTEFSTKANYTLEWPDEGVLSPEAEHELLLLCFMDSNATTFDEAAQKWLSTPFSYEDEMDCERKPVKSIDENGDYSYMHLESTCTEDSTLAVFTIKTESFVFGAAHGMYSVDYLTIDKATGNSVHLTDLVSDTNLLCEAIAHAIYDLEVNKEVRECLFDEFREIERMPMPSNFLIDSDRNNITVDYALYEITPYACGIQSVVLPIFWLSKHVSLSPYAKRLFGPESYIEE